MVCRRFEPERAVEIVGPTYGSGYRIGGRLVLTAAHLFPAGVGSACRARSKPTFGTVDATVAWTAPGADIALVALPDIVASCEPVAFGALPSEPDKVRFDLYGWPKWARTTRSGQTPKAGGRHIDGLIYLADTSPEGLLVLEPERIPEASAPDQSGSDWEGLSGAAVICDGLVVAVQRHHQNPRRPASLEAEPLTKVHGDEGWRRLLERHGMAPTLVDRASSRSHPPLPSPTTREPTAMAKIYLSATYTDLKAYRDAVYRILRMLRHDVIAMEDYVATDAYPLHQCLADVAGCDVYVGLVGWRYGYVPDRDNPARQSITELEYRKAGESSLPRLLFLADKNAPWPDEFRDSNTGDGEGGRRIAAFRAELENAKLVSYFRTPDHLAGLASAAVQRCLEEKPAGAAKPRTRLLQAKSQALAQRLDALLQDYQSATEQLAYTLSAVDQNKLKRQMESLEREMERVESELDALNRAGG